MKKSLKILSLAVMFPVLFSVATTKESTNLQVSAYSATTLTKTIDLNDCSSDEVRNYYSNLNTLSEADRKGDNLLKALKPILSNNQKYYSYDSGNGIWQMYEIIDRDWAKSPATAITQGTYNPTTKIITDYSYGSTSNKKDNPYLHALYVDRTIDNPKTAWDAHGKRNEVANIEREHIWPKSHGFDADEVAGARGDPMHLWAADGSTNGIHSNYFYGKVDQTKTFEDSKTKYAWSGHNLLGYSKTITGSTEKVFEPQDCDKGDIARACFYMVARYNNIAGNDTSIDSANPNLCLGNDVSKSEETGTSTATKVFSLGILLDLLEWNKLDPVDEFEIHRNNLLFKNYTNNRNPFIDFPEWADAIWGNPATAVAADPTKDELFKGGTYVAPKGDDTPKTDGNNVDDGKIFGMEKHTFYMVVVCVGCTFLCILLIAYLVGSKKTKKKIAKGAKSVAKDMGVNIPGVTTKKTTNSTKKSTNSTAKKSSGSSSKTTKKK